MSTVLYFSNSCQHSQKLLQYLSRSPQAKDIHFVCVDKRAKQPDGSVHIILPNGSNLLLPPNVTRVPALLLLKKNNHVLFGDDIMRYLQPQEARQTEQATQGNGEPSAYAFGSGGGSWGVSSDSFSFWDQSADSLMAEGDGGLRQMHNYATPGMVSEIETPDDNYEPDKVDASQMERYQAGRSEMDTMTKGMFRPNI